MLLGTFVDEVWWPACAKLRECTRVGYESSYRCHIRSRWSYAIEGIISQNGQILGKMGHTERYEKNLFKNIAGNKEQNLFRNAVDYFRKK